jgi:hypothetical protein
LSIGFSHRWGMTRKEQFLMFVFFGALNDDLKNDTHEAQLIAYLASQIPDNVIPFCPQNAAKTFLHHCRNGMLRPHRWMKEREPENILQCEFDAAAPRARRA